MSFIKKALKGAVVAKGLQILSREAAKPENQRKARELLAKVTKGGRRR
ncbi:hypothetical protein [Georgenia yuyongxinii]